MAQLKVQQKRGTVGIKANQRETLRTLGLKRIGDVVVKEDRPEIRGQKVLTESPEIQGRLVYLVCIPSVHPESPALLDLLEIPQRLHS